jgi:hypothetical protein
MHLFAGAYLNVFIDPHAFCFAVLFVTVAQNSKRARPDDGLLAAQKSLAPRGLRAEAFYDPGVLCCFDRNE